MLSRYRLESYQDDVFHHYFIKRRGEGVPIILAKSEKLSGRIPEYRLSDDSELLLTIFAAKMPNMNCEDL